MGGEMEIRFTYLEIWPPGVARSLLKKGEVGTGQAGGTNTLDQGKC